MKSLLPRAMRLLAQRDYSEQEMRRKLAAHSPFDGFSKDRYAEKTPISEESINQVIEYCHQHNWLNDADYARRFIISRSNKGYGSQRIQSELQQKGINRDEIRHAMSECEVDWYLKAREVAVRRFGYELPTDWKEKSKVQRYLAYRGFMQDEIQSVFTDSE
ncbi:Regulatory protein recX [Pragia fontium]|uniref:regulatory protein RecX n=1 Tax=Pragia fontium TaxID=82985 RepID=UPI00064B42B8|nr:regulatory protein RecX [Pragia fontium]AKJ41647.1 recombinase RecX [Pragia fontium]SUB81871.1 Regulatory protein recX [Pragia fontium]